MHTGGVRDARQAGRQQAGAGWAGDAACEEAEAAAGGGPAGHSSRSTTHREEQEQSLEGWLGKSCLALVPWCVRLPARAT